MGQEYPRDSESKTLRRFPQHLLILIGLAAIVGTNVVILYAFSQNCNSGGDSSRSSDSHISNLLNSTIGAYEKELAKLRGELKSLHQGTERIVLDRTQSIWSELMARPLTCPHGGSDSKSEDPKTNAWALWAAGEIPRELQNFVESRQLPLGWSSTLQRFDMMSPVGHGCALLSEDLEKYMSYEVGKECPDDETTTQKLLVGGCEPLPRRRCFTRIPKNYTEPLPVPAAHWDAGTDDKITWTAYTCKSFECLRNRVKDRVFADCLDCFDLEGRERNRWMSAGGELDYSVEEVVQLKKGTLRIGLDLGGGTGSFAVRMREHDVTIVTTTLNLNGPFNNFVALRGVIPMYMTVAQRLPFYDHTLDIVHSMHVLSNWIPTESLEFILFDIDRILRPGGVFWLDHFFCVKSQLATYEPLIAQLGYTKLKYHVGDKVDRGRELEEVYISALLEKPMKRFSSQ